MKEKVRYTNYVNLSGLASKTPIKCRWKPKYNGYWDSSGNIDANELGLIVQDGIIQYTSYDYKDVKLWTFGADSVMIMLREWCHD